MSIHLVGCAAEQPIPAAAKLALMAFADSADDYTHVSLPGYEKVQKWASVGRSRSAELVAELVDLNLLRQHKRGRRGHRAEYVVFPNGCCPAHPRHVVDGEVDHPESIEPKGSAVPDPNSLTGSDVADPNRGPEKGSGIPDSTSVKGSGTADPNQPDSKGSGTADPSRSKGPERVRHSGPLPKQETTTPLAPTSGGTEPTGCSRHPNGPGDNCRACGTTPRKIAERRRREKTERKRLEDLAAIQGERQARTTAPPATPAVIASVKAIARSTR